VCTISLLSCLSCIDAAATDNYPLSLHDALPISGQVTISRLSKSSDGYRMLIMRGEALDEPKKFNGTTVSVCLDGNAEEMVHTLMMEGFEPHYSIVYADIVDELKELCKLLKIDTVEMG